MEVIELGSWSDFDAALREVRASLARNQGQTGVSEMIFRGQSDATWALDTTLERFDEFPRSFLEYYRMMRVAHPQVEAHTGRSWPMPEYKFYEEWTKNFDSIYGYPREWPAYDFMAYLRHHGYPSPLLDWSRSPYVAAFYAVRHQGEGRSGRVAVYAYCEDVGHGKTSGSSHPQIVQLGPYVSTHRRHFLQQCQYTVCGSFTPDHGWFYKSHSSVFTQEQREQQDVLWKITFPGAERERVLAHLDDFNLNAHSLFGTEDTLMETVAERYRLGRKRR